MIEQQNRGEQLAALRKIKIKSAKHRGRTVSGSMCKMVLRIIDDRAGQQGCFASQATIAEEVGCSVATVSRAVSVLTSMDLITIERPNPYSPNHVHINWTAVFQRVAACQDGDGTTPTQVWPDANPDLAPSQAALGTEPRSSWPEAMGNAPSIATSNAPTNRPDEWAEVVADCYRWGLKSAAVAVDAARQSGWSIEFVRELFIEAGGNREPQRWEPGQLANWLTGKTPPPFDEHEAAQRAAARIDGPAKREADEIRESVGRDGRSRGVAEFIIEGLTFRKLAAVDLDRFATEAEKAAAVRLDELDRERSEKLLQKIVTAKCKRSEKPSRSVNARSGSASSVIDEPQSRERASVGRTGRQRQDAANLAKARTQNRGLFQRIPSGNRGTRAFDRRRVALLDALGGGS
ncbi:helix-turn-helix transcriptional regulator [Rhodopirellula europaea]|uniref:helix-turn-helix transcriptional regulator n=1 Tax=Rhodopirellula europaea TaxID=1263866 RepID=UPI003D2A0E5C